MDFIRKQGQMGGKFLMIPQADVSCIRRKWLDLPYANISNTQVLDIYLPDEGEGPFPIVLHVHGGGFEIGDKRDMPVSSYFIGLKHGYAIVSVNYRLSGEATFPAGLQDLKAAIRWLKANQNAYHLDGNRIAACGGSAGGNYAAMLLLTPGRPELEDLDLGNPGYPSNIQVAVDMFGPTDFLKMDEQLADSGLGPADHNQADSPESKYMGAKITEIPLLVQKANPITYIHKNMPPILIQHGRKDHLVPVQQSIVFAERLKKLVPPDRFEFDILENADHGDPLFETPENMDRVFSFLDKHLENYHEIS
jgi:acetyl esterase/lipase